MQSYHFPGVIVFFMYKRRAASSSIDVDRTVIYPILYIHGLSERVKPGSDYLSPSQMKFCSMPGIRGRIAIP